MLGLAEVLREWLDHRREVLVRRSKFRLGEIEHRLEMLGGFLIAYLNLDKVIKIIRKEDEPKPVLMKTFKLSEIQADAILNMRLRNLRRLEEMEIKAEDKALKLERTEVEIAARLDAEAVEDGRRPDQGHSRAVRAQDRARQAPHRLRRSAGA